MSEIDPPRCTCGAPLQPGAHFCPECRAVLDAADGSPDRSLAGESGLPAAGEVVNGDYRVNQEIGRGSVCVVYRAENLRSGEPVALRFLRPSRTDVRNRERFRREAELGAQLDHPNIPRVHDDDHWKGLPYMVMHLIEGRDLKELLRAEGPFDPVRVVRIMLQVCGAVATVHQLRVVHRDIRPRNIVVTAEGHAWLLDLGFALDTRADRLTPAGRSVGTPAYMAPEVALALPEVDNRADVWSLGATMFELLSGELPFWDEVPLKLMEKIVQTDAPPLHSAAPEVPPDLAEIVDRCLTYEAWKRYPRIGELQQALGALPIDGPPAPDPAT